MRARRLASIVVAAVVAALSLSACRSDPGVAAYVDGHRYTLDEVSGIFDEIKADVRPEQQADVRSTVVKMLVMRGVATRYAKDKGITVPDADADAFAQRTGLPPGKRYTELAAGFQAALSVVRQAAPSVAPSEADQREAHSHITVQGQPISDSFESVQKYLGQDQLGKLVGFRDALRSALSAADVAINPRYADQVFQVTGPLAEGQAQTWLALPLGTTANPVTDLPSSAAPENPVS